MIFDAKAIEMRPVLTQPTIVCAGAYHTLKAWQTLRAYVCGIFVI